MEVRAATRRSPLARGFGVLAAVLIVVIVAALSMETILRLQSGVPVTWMPAKIPAAELCRPLATVDGDTLPAGMALTPHSGGARLTVTIELVGDEARVRRAGYLEAACRPGEAPSRRECVLAGEADERLPTRLFELFQWKGEVYVETPAGRVSSGSDHAVHCRHVDTPQELDAGEFRLCDRLHGEAVSDEIHLAYIDLGTEVKVDRVEPVQPGSEAIRVFFVPLDGSVVSADGELDAPLVTTGGGLRAALTACGQ